MTEYLTVDSLDAVFKKVGLTARDVASRRQNRDGSLGDHGLYFDCTLASTGDYRMILVVTTYSRNEKGARYFGLDGEVATETRRFFIESMGDLEPCPVSKEEKIESTQ